MFGLSELFNREHLYVMTIYLEDEDICFFGDTPDIVRERVVLYLKNKYAQIFAIFPDNRSDKYLINRYFSERKIRKSPERCGNIYYLHKKENGLWSIPE